MDKTKKGILGIGVLAAIAVITFAFAIAASGSDGGVIEQNAEGVTVAASEVTSSINYQGRLTDSAGEPLSGTYDMTFRLYEYPSSTALDTDTHSVEVTDGLFNTNIDFDQSYFDGRELWFGIIIEGEVMTPRQEFKPVPYALSLRPGAVINGSVSGPVLEVKNVGDGGCGVRAESDKGYGVRGSGSKGGGYFVQGPVGPEPWFAIQSEPWSAIESDGKNAGVYGAGKYGGYFTTTLVLPGDGHTAGVNATTFYDNSDGVRVSTSGDHSDGVRVSTRGDSSTGVHARSTKFHGVYGRTDSADSAGVYARGKDSGADIILGGNANTGAGDDGAIYSDPDYPSSDIFLIANDGVAIILDKNGDGEDADFGIFDKDNKLLFNVDESGDMTASGDKAAVVTTKDYGTRKMYAIESTEVWFEDFGMTQLNDGVAVVEIDPVFAATVNLSVAYHVFFTPVDDWAPIYVANKTSTSFELRDAHDEADITLEYRIVARRLGYEDVRMEQVEFGNEEA